MEQLLEFTDSRGQALRVDREKGIISGVKILGQLSANKRRYTPEAIAKAAGLYEGRKVNIDHRIKEGVPRSYAERIGSLKGVTVREGELYGDLHYNPKHKLAEQLAWDAEHAPENVGLSHDASGRTRKENGTLIVEEILSVNSVDLVADPATTRGLFEHAEETELVLTEGLDMAADLKALTLESLKESRPDLASAILLEHSHGEAAKAQKAEFDRLKLENDAFKLKEAVAARRTKIDALLTEAKLPKEAQTEIFVGALLEAKDDAAIAALIEDRKALVGLAAKAKPASKPISKPANGDGDDLQESQIPDGKRMGSLLRAG